MSTEAPAAVRKSVTVEATPERAWEVFTERIGAWWPLATFRIRADVETAVLEPRGGGRVYELAAGGEEADWGRVLAYEPPHRLVFSWDITEPATEVEVRFSAVDGGTLVELEHRGWESLGPDAETERATYDPGWTYVLGCYEEAIRTPS